DRDLELPFTPLLDAEVLTAGCLVLVVDAVHPVLCAGLTCARYAGTSPLFQLEAVAIVCDVLRRFAGEVQVFDLLEEVGFESVVVFDGQPNGATAVDEHELEPLVTILHEGELAFADVVTV